MVDSINEWRGLASGEVIFPALKKLQNPRFANQRNSPQAIAGLSRRPT
jgi:hypothetical protein